MNDIYSLEKIMLSVSESVFLVKLLNCEALIATLFLSLVFNTVNQSSIWDGGGFSLYYLKSRI